MLQVLPPSHSSPSLDTIILDWILFKPFSRLKETPFKFPNWYLQFLFYLGNCSGKKKICSNQGNTYTQLWELEQSVGWIMPTQMKDEITGFCLQTAEEKLCSCWTTANQRVRDTRGCRNKSQLGLLATGYRKHMAWRRPVSKRVLVYCYMKRYKNVWEIVTKWWCQFE